ncbi:DHH family phosphoesterase [Haloimpatiens lingqiaonensis]|uniref:DHH family phosphoesterase n=1 Tax=Haloimpatiens lingqiaonensis TaxID=1380675 RepID=UPI0010FF283E|nr:bifunctional oligoribonuclease/PAP phosphatase NrnA [Haloimpatiens lingqiaonensis]
MIMNDILKKISESENIVITFHESPDGDSIGTSLALMQGLKKFHKNVKIISKDCTPDYLQFLPYSKEIDGTKNFIPQNTDCVLVVDCGDVKRINVENLDLENRKYTLINIDHHLSNEMYGDYNYVDTNAIAVAEIIYQMLKILNVSIDEDMATCLYTSLITDSGSFRHLGTTSVTHAIAGDLINVGIDFSEIHRKVFENKPLSKIKLYGKIIEDMKMFFNDKLCLMRITQDMINSLGMEIDDTGDAISFGTSINTVEVAVLLKEWNNGTKVSLRSKNKVDVRKIAETFNGGGHTRAAGLFLELSIDKAEETIKKALEKELI